MTQLQKDFIKSKLIKTGITLAIGIFILLFCIFGAVAFYVLGAIFILFAITVMIGLAIECFYGEILEYKMRGFLTKEEIHIFYWQNLDWCTEEEQEEFKRIRMLVKEKEPKLFKKSGYRDINNFNL